MSRSEQLKQAVFSPVEDEVYEELLGTENQTAVPGNLNEYQSSVSDFEKHQIMQSLDNLELLIDICRRLNVKWIVNPKELIMLAGRVEQLVEQGRISLDDDIDPLEIIDLLEITTHKMGRFIQGSQGEKMLNDAKERLQRKKEEKKKLDIEKERIEQEKRNFPQFHNITNPFAMQPFQYQRLLDFISFLPKTSQDTYEAKVLQPYLGSINDQFIEPYNNINNLWKKIVSQSKLGATLEGNFE